MTKDEALKEKELRTKGKFVWLAILSFVSWEEGSKTWKSSQRLALIRTTALLLVIETSTRPQNLWS